MWSSRKLELWSLSDGTGFWRAGSLRSLGEHSLVKDRAHAFNDVRLYQLSEGVIFSFKTTILWTLMAIMNEDGEQYGPLSIGTRLNQPYLYQQALGYSVQKCQKPGTRANAQIQRVSNSGLTQLGCGLLARIEGPNFCRMTMIGIVPKKVMMPCAAKHNVNPDVACHGAMKNCERAC